MLKGWPFKKKPIAIEVAWHRFGCLWSLQELWATGEFEGRKIVPICEVGIGDVIIW